MATYEELMLEMQRLRNPQSLISLPNARFTPSMNGSLVGGKTQPSTLDVLGLSKKTVASSNIKTPTTNLGIGGLKAVGGNVTGSNPMLNTAIRSTPNVSATATQDIGRGTQAAGGAGGVGGFLGSAQGLSSIVSLVNTGVNVATSIIGANAAKKMKPFIASSPAAIEPELIKDNTAAVKAAAEGNITRAVNSQRDLDRRLGITNRGAVYLGKELEAKNNLASSLQQNRNQVNAQNAGIINQTRQFNKQLKTQVDLQNAQTINQFEQWKSGVVGAGYSNAMNAATQGTQAIFDNVQNYKQEQISNRAVAQKNVDDLKDAYIASIDTINYRIAKDEYIKARDAFEKNNPLPSQNIWRKQR